MGILLRTLQSLPGDMLLRDALLEVERMKSCVTHHDVCLDNQRTYYEKNKDEINRRRREKRAALKKNNADS